MATLKLKNINKIYEGGFHAVKDFSLDIEDKEFIIFVGPSGCGKSTTLRMIAGLEDISSGELWIDDVLVNDVEPSERDVAMVFQNYALYPHMTIYENMAFALRIRKVDPQEIDRLIHRAAEILDIDHLLDRKPKALSGGQRQRVAMGRAIVRNPKVFLMDEPLSNLDAKLRVQMRTEIAKLHKKLGTTTIYVTHDQTEAMTLGTRIVVIKDGVIQQVDTPKKLYEKPGNIFVAGFMGSPQMNFMDMTIVKEGDHVFLKRDDISIKLEEHHQSVLENAGYRDKEITVGIRPEHLHLKPGDYPGEENLIKTEIRLYEMIGAEVFLHFEAAGLEFSAREESKTDVKDGDKVKFLIDPEEIHMFDKETELRIL